VLITYSGSYETSMHTANSTLSTGNEETNHNAQSARVIVQV